MSEPSINSNNEFVYVFRKRKSQPHQQKEKMVDKAAELDKNSIVKNQEVPYVKTNFEANRSSAFYTTCQYCQKKVLTKSIQTFNFCTCVFCFCAGFLIYSIIQMIRGKDICCYDAEHRCPECQQVICEYHSCC